MAQGAREAGSERRRERVRQWERVKAEPVLVSRFVVWYTAGWTTWGRLRPCLHVSDNLMSIIIHRSSDTRTYMYSHIRVFCSDLPCALHSLLFPRRQRCPLIAAQLHVRMLEFFPSYAIITGKCGSWISVWSEIMSCVWDVWMCLSCG